MFVFLYTRIIIQTSEATTQPKLSRKKKARSQKP